MGLCGKNPIKIPLKYLFILDNNPIYWVHRVSQYHTEFQSIIVHLELNDEAKILYFRNGLDARIEKHLIGREKIPNTFEDFVQLTIRLDNDIRAFEARQNYRQVKSSYPTRSYQHYYPRDSARQALTSAHEVTQHREN